MHLQLSQIPPSSARSKHALLIPSCARRMAAAYPPGLDPISTTSYEMLISLLLRAAIHHDHRTNQRDHCNRAGDQRGHAPGDTVGLFHAMPTAIGEVPVPDLKK